MTLDLHGSCQLSPSGVSIGTKTHFCDVPTMPGAFILSIRRRRRRLNERGNAALLFFFIICPLSPPLLSGCLFSFGPGSTDWLNARTCRVTLGMAANAHKSAQHTQPCRADPNVPAPVREQRLEGNAVCHPRPECPGRQKAGRGC